MLEQKTVTVGDDALVIESLPATRALQVLAKTARIAGGFGRGIKDMPSSLQELKNLGRDLEKYLHLGDMLEGFLERLDDEDAPGFIKSIVLESLPAYRDRSKKDFDDWYEYRFSREPAALLTLLGEIYRWNYGDSFEWLFSFFAAAQERGEDPAPGQQEPSSQSSRAASAKRARAK